MNLGNQCGWNVSSRNDLLASFAQLSPAARATGNCHRHSCRLFFLCLLRRCPKPEIPLARLPPRRLRIGLTRTFGKGSRRSSLLQLLDLGSKLLDQAMLIENDLEQFLPAK